MKQLAKEIKGRASKKGSTLKQLKASKHAYLYECTGDKFNTHYEVFRHKENTYFNCVSYPGDEAFGKWAWTFDKKSEALHQFDVLNMEGGLKKPVCECGKEMVFYHSMMTHACLKCHRHIKSVSWSEKESLEKFNDGEFEVKNTVHYKGGE